MNKARVSQPGRPGPLEPQKNPDQPPSGSALAGASEVLPNPLEARQSELRELFRSARFNRTDRLDAYAGDFSSFRDLGAIVTSDMRHQMEKQPCPPHEPAGLDSNERRPAGLVDPSERLPVERELPGVDGPFAQAYPVRLAPERCLRRPSRSGGCARCLNACPFGALQIAENGIDIDRRRCRACGCCEAACPTGALQLRDPAHETVLLRLKTTLAGRVPTGGPAPTLVLHETAARATVLPDSFGPGGEPVVRFEAEGIGRIGAETMMAALAWGALRVVVWLPSTHSAAVTASLQHQVRMAWAILAGLGQPADRVSVAEGIAPQVGGLLTAAAAPAQFAPLDDRRELLRSAVRHLFEQCPSRAHEVDLPRGSPYGAVRVSPKACTFCMACAGACPTGALSSGQGLPSLRFVEARCVQCGRCAETCPEQAVTLTPRLLLAAGAAGSARVLAEETPFACVRCGTPFAPLRMIERMAAKLEGHWMYRRPEDLRRLRMCATCRVRDLYRPSGGAG
jgi:ferredoxin